MNSSGVSLPFDLSSQRSTLPFKDPKIVSTYEAWYQTFGRQADRLEKGLLKWLLEGFPHTTTVLEVGCGTGHFTRWFGEQGMRAVGLDLSRPMLNEGKRQGDGVYLQGDAFVLPFLSKSFDLVALITTLEFLPDPAKALVETKRVAKQGLILGVLNAQSHLGRRYKREGGPIWSIARFFTPAELKHLIIKIYGEHVSIFWRSTLWQFWPAALPLPWGGFIGMGVKFS